MEAEATASRLEGGRAILFLETALLDCKLLKQLT